MPLPLIALVGRPNVGKSTLFNRLVGSRAAIVEDVPGTTRDRLYGRSDWGGRDFAVVDTGGLGMATDDPETIAMGVRNQALLAIDEADVIVCVTDGGDGVTSEDGTVAELLRRSGKPVVLAVNKAERRDNQLGAAEFWALGLGEPMPISALHGIGTGDLLDAVIDLLPPSEQETEAEGVRVAILGRPNVGKSSIVNRLTRDERVVVSPVPGTTRDAIDTPLDWEGNSYVLIDTAGIRRRGRIDPGIERYSVLRAMRALERSDVAVLVIDAVDGVTAQDAHVAGYMQDAGVGAIIAINKWDLVEKDSHTAIEYERSARAALKFLDFAPAVFVSALSGQRVTRILQLASEIERVRMTRVPTSELNRLVSEVTARQPLTRGGRRLKIRYATQAGTRPPTFVFFVNNTEMIHFSYERYLENQLRARYPFEGTPIRLVFRAGLDRRA